MSERDVTLGPVDLHLLGEGTHARLFDKMGAQPTTREGKAGTQFSVWVQQLIAGRPVRLSRAQLETLAIIAYRQPITRPEVDEIRGVDSSATLRLLMDRSLIRILGKKEDVGRPMLYGTTKEFLDFFSLGDLRELPTLREYSELTAESRQVMSDRLGIPVEAASASAYRSRSRAASPSHLPRSP